MSQENMLVLYWHVCEYDGAHVWLYSFTSGITHEMHEFLKRSFGNELHMYFIAICRCCCF